NGGDNHGRRDQGREREGKADSARKHYRISRAASAFAPLQGLSQGEPVGADSSALGANPAALGSGSGLIGLTARTDGGPTVRSCTLLRRPPLRRSLPAGGCLCTSLMARKPFRHCPLCLLSLVPLSLVPPCPDSLMKPSRGGGVHRP